MNLDRTPVVEVGGGGQTHRINLGHVAGARRVDDGMGAGTQPHVEVYLAGGHVLHLAGDPAEQFWQLYTPPTPP